MSRGGTGPRHAEPLLRTRVSVSVLQRHHSHSAPMVSQGHSHCPSPPCFFHLPLRPAKYILLLNGLEVLERANSHLMINANPFSEGHREGW